MHVTLLVHLYAWECPDCGSIQDRSLELTLEGRALGRWFEDGHQGFTAINDNAVEYLLTQHLALDFLDLERVRSLRSARRQADPGLGPELDATDHALFDKMLGKYGHTLARKQVTFVGS